MAKYKDLGPIRIASALISASLCKWCKDGRYIESKGVMRFLIKETDKRGSATNWREFDSSEQLAAYLELRAKRLQKQASAIH